MRHHHHRDRSPDHGWAGPGVATGARLPTAEAKASGRGARHGGRSRGPRGRDVRRRRAGFATDIGPHWAPKEFMEWDGFRRLWGAAMRWLAGEGPTGVQKRGPPGVAARAASTLRWLLKHLIQIGKREPGAEFRGAQRTASVGEGDRGRERLTRVSEYARPPMKASPSLVVSIA